MRKATVQQGQKSWLAFAAILAGFLLTGIGGLLILSWVSSAAASAAGATAFPVAQTPAAQPTVLEATAASNPTSLPDTPTALPTRTKPTGAPSEGSTATPSVDQFQLTVVHTNDTWGYVDPCG